VLAPLQYTGLLWAAILGWLIWDDIPTLPIVIGNAIIIGSGLYVAARGKMVGKAAE
jgi:drug/metabolite transporter (DMT)-like permease